MRRILKNSALWSAIAVIINSAMNLCIIPIVSKNIGIEAYGFVTLANTMITYIDIVSIAINSFASRYTAIEYHNGKIENANKYYSTVFFADVILGIVILVLMTIFVPNIHIFLNVSDRLFLDVKLLFYTVFIRYVFVLLRSAFEVPAFIKNQLYLTERIRTASYVIQTMLLIATCILMSAKVWYVGVASAVAAIFMFIAEVTIARIIAPDLTIKTNYFSKKNLKDVIVSGVWNSINNLGNQLNSGLDLLITNQMLTELALGIISISKTFGSMCYILVNSVGNALKPKQLESYSKNDIEDLISQFKIGMKITGTLCALIIAGFYCWGQDFLNLWLGSQNIDNIFVLSMLALFGDVITGVVNPLFYAYTLTNKIKLPCFITILLGLINVISMFLLIKYTSLGMYAVIATTMVLNWVHFFDTPIYASHCLKIPLMTFYPTIFRHLINVLVLMISMHFISYLVPNALCWSFLLVKVFCCGLIELALSFLIMTDKNEKRCIVRMVIKWL